MPDAPSTDAIRTVPSFSISTEAPVSSVMARITAPPFPMTSRILSGSILMVMMVGAHSLISSRGALMTLFISPRMCRRASRAWSSALFMISRVMPWILMSICSAVTPSSEPATLKSISPRWSSSPRISVRTAKSSPSLTRPMATPATGALTGTPASISARLVPQTDAIELEPFDSVISETTRIT